MGLSNAATFAESLDDRKLGKTPAGWQPVRVLTHPFLFDAMDIITHDGGGGCHHHYNVPPGWVEALPRMELVLGRLTASQRETMAIGCCDEQEALVREFEGLDVAHRFLNAFFEDFIERESIDAL